MQHILIIVFLLIAFWSFSQDTDEPVKIRFDLEKGSANIDYEREFVVKGSPYLNEEYQIGSIVQGESRKEALIRYNAYYDHFQILDENKKKASVAKSSEIKVILEGKTYEMLSYERTVKDKALYYLPQSGNQDLDKNKKQGYFYKLSDGQTKLYSKTFKRIPKFQIPEHGYERFEPSAFVTITHYYIKKKFRPAVRIELSKKEVLFALNDKYNEVRAYIKKKKLKVKTLEEMINIIAYYNTLD